MSMLEKSQALASNLAKLTLTYWNAFLLAIALIGFLVGELWPPMKAYKDSFVVLGAVAAVLTLLEVKLLLEKRREAPLQLSKVRMFRTMREARSDILSGMVDQVRLGSKGSITIVGGRIRSIIELIREFSDLVSREAISNNPGCKIRLFMMSPEFVGNLLLPGAVEVEKQKERSAAVMAQMRAALQEIENLVKSTSFSAHKINFEIDYYNDIPFAYYYLLGDERIFFGGYIWNEKTADLDGPSSQCWEIVNSASEFSAMHNWLQNRAAFLGACSELRKGTDIQRNANFV